MNLRFCSKVVRGEQLGRTINFPTANLLVDSSESLPSNGVYAARAWFEGAEYAAMVYIGGKPTVVQNGARVVEVNIIDFSGDLYDHILEVEILDFIRGEQRFASLEQLGEQISRDKEAILAALASR